MPPLHMVGLILEFNSVLRPLLRRSHDHGRVLYGLDRRASIKDIIESLGVPHTEVGDIRINGRAVDFAHHPEDGDRVVVSGVDPPMDVTRPTRLRPAPLGSVSFLVDENVGKLASLLRVLGYDTVSAIGISDARLASTAHTQGRIVLTRDTALLKRRQVVFGRLIRAIRPDEQLLEVVTHFGLVGPHTVFCRCMECNTLLTPVAKADIDHRLEPKTRRYFDSFKYCSTCDRIYWRGSHCDRMIERLHRLGIRVAAESSM